MQTFRLMNRRVYEQITTLETDDDDDDVSKSQTDSQCQERFEQQVYYLPQTI